MLVNNQESGQLQEGKVVDLLLLPAHKQSSETVDPTVSPLYNPPSGLFTLLLVLFLFASGTDMRGIAKIEDNFFDKAVIVAFVETQVLQSVLGRRHYHHCFERINQNWVVLQIGCCLNFKTWFNAVLGVV